MQQVGAQWLMTSLAPTPFYVALVPAANLLPVFCFSLAAGALADILDRRRLLIACQAAMAAVALALGLMVAGGGIGPLSLLAFTFALGTGAAFAGPAWQSVVPHLVPKRDLPAAIALNSAGFNLARAIGPAIGGLLIGAAGIAAPFLVNAASFVAVIAAFWFWRRPRPATSHLPSERLSAAILAGLRYARESRPLRATLIRTLAFFVFGASYWALLPLILRLRLGAGPEAFGLVMASVGAGAVGGAVVLARLRRRVGADRVVALGTVGTALVIVVFALAPSLWVVAATGVVAGICWILVVPTLNTSAQLSVPDWMRGRGLALFQMAMFGGIGGGSVLWGRIADQAGVTPTLLVAAAGAIAAMLASWRCRLQADGGADLGPAQPWPEPLVALPIANDRGPVLVTIEYRVSLADSGAFLAAVQALGGSRKRGGAYAWGVFEDAAAPGRWLECFVVESWLTHLRQHARVTGDDRRLQDQVRALHQGEARPVVHHYLAPHRD